METSEEDEVVAELDVFLTNRLADSIKLLQYPNYKRNNSFSSDSRLVARVKPKHKKIELEVLLDVSSPNYDQSKGEQIAINVDGCASTSGEGMAFESSVMDTQILTSSCIPQMGKRYAAATISGGQVHLTPINEVMQMRPSFKYMDKAEKRAIQAAQLKAQAESGNSSQDEADDAKTVTVRFKGAETEAARAARERSYAAYEKNLFEEKWISTTIHTSDDDYCKRERNHMFCNSQYFQGPDMDSSHDLGQMTLPVSDYLKSIVPNYVSAEVDSVTNPSNVLSLANLQTMSLPEQLRAVMCNVKIIHFSHLLKLLPGNPEPNSVVRSLQSYAVLVQGCWIVKSEILYPTKTLSPVSGTPCDIVCKARDYILCLFSNDKYLVRRELIKKVKVPSEEVKAILEDIAIMKTGHGWHLRLEPDVEFIKQYPEVCERQAMVWSARYKQLDHQLQISSTGSKKQDSQKLFKKKSTKQKVDPSSLKPNKGVNFGKLGNKLLDIDTSAEMDHNAEIELSEIEPMDVQFSDEVLNGSNPFVIPQTLGIGMGLIGPSTVNSVGLKAQGANGLDVLPQSTSGLHSSINMESINSTVQLVTKQMYRQSNLQPPFDGSDMNEDQTDLLFNNNNIDPH